MLKTITKIWTTALLALLCASSAQAKLVAHYDFSDGELLDNEVGADYALRSMKPAEASQAEVQLDRMAGTAIFPLNTAQSPWLESEGLGAPENFTVSFWFRTGLVRQGSRSAGLFASDTDVGKGNWMVYSDRHLGGALDLMQFRKGAGTPIEPHAPNVWQHVVVRRIAADLPRHELTITPLGGRPGEPIVSHAGYHSTFEKIVLGTNHRAHRGYRMEMANVKIFDDSDVAVGSLFKEGPGIREFGKVPLLSVKKTISRLADEAAQLREELRALPQIGDSLSLDAYGYHSDYLPALEDVPEEPRWVVEIGMQMKHSFNELYLIPAGDRRMPGMPGYGFPKRFRLISIDEDGRTEVLADWRDRDYPDPGRFPVRFAGTNRSLQKIMLAVYRGVVEGGKEFFAIDEVMGRVANFVVKGQSVETSGSFESLPFWSADYLIDQKTSLGLPVRPATDGVARQKDFVWIFLDNYSGRVAIDLDFGENRTTDMISLLPARPPEGLVVPGYGFPQSVELQIHAATAEGGREIVLKTEMKDISNPGNNTVRLVGLSQSARWLRLIFDGFPMHKGRTTFALGEIDVQGRSESIGRSAEVRMQLLESGREVAGLDLLNDGRAGGAEVVPLIFWLDGLSQNKILSQRLAQVEMLQHRLSQRWERSWKMGRVIGLSVLGALLLAVAGVALALRWRHARKMQLRVEEEHRQTELEQMKLRFFTHVSHELRTPLTLILGPIEKLLGELQRDDQKNLLGLAHRNVKKLHALVDQLLDFRKLQDGRLELEWSSVDLGRFVRNGFEIYQSMAADNQISYRLDCPDAVGRIAVDAGKFQSIMDNLIANALKYTPEGGSVTVEVDVQERQIRFVVEDTGVGIAAADLPCVFEQYFRADGLEVIQAKGSGIGLAYVKGLVDMWGGVIGVESPVADGKGTRFAVTLPVGESVESGMLDVESSERLVESETPETSPETLPTSHPSLSTILLVEDNEDVREFVKMELAGEYRVLEAENGRIGLELAVEHQPDLVLSDVMMPEMDGIELCRRLKNDEATSHIPVIMLTARGSQEHQLEGLQTGADDYVSKPFSMPILKMRIHNQLEMRRKLRERFGREIITVEPSEITVNSVDEQFLQRAIGVVEKHMDDFEFDVEALASELNMVGRTLRRKLRAMLDQSPAEFVRILRLKRAAQLLKESGENISDIAAQVGFLEPTHFSRGFKSQFGVSPSEYRKQAHGKT